MPMQLTFSVSKETADFVRDRAREMGTSIDEVVAEALALVRERQRQLAVIRAELAEADADPHRYSLDEVEGNAELLLAFKSSFDQAGRGLPALAVSAEELEASREIVRRVRAVSPWAD